MARVCEEMVARMSEPNGLQDPAVCAHLEACADCRAALATTALLEETRREPTPEQLVALRARLRPADDRRVAAPHRARAWLGPAIAGGLAAAAATLIWLGPGTHHPASPESGVAETSGGRSNVAATSNGAFDDSPEDSWATTVAGEDWTSETADNLDDNTNAVVALMDWTGT